LLKPPPEKVSTVIGKDTTFKGTIRAKGPIRIDGKVEGEIHTQGDVIIGESGWGVLDLKALNVSVAGRFEGTLEAEGKLDIRSSGAVLGNIKANGLVVDDGAVFSGSIVMRGKEQPGKGSDGAVPAASRGKTAP